MDHPVRAVSPAVIKLRLINLGAVIIPFAGLIAAGILLWGVGFDWTHLIVGASLALLSAVGITVGYHRLFTHRSFQTGPVVRYILAAMGSLAVEGPVIEWAGTHRRHHQHADDDGDPHSPHHFGGGVKGTLRGLYHAHIGWLFTGRPKGLRRYTADLHADPVIEAASRQFYIWVMIGLLLPAVLGGLITMSWMGVLLGFLWGGLARVFLVHHITWSVNSVCHLWGYRPFRSHDESRNNVIVGFLGLGEGWHNNHHAFPASARHGLRWWEFDLSYCIIRALAFFRLAHGIRVPSRDRIDSMRHSAGARAAIPDGPASGAGRETAAPHLGRQKSPQSLTRAPHPPATHGGPV
jgi:stearoyl-CoA desaturase (delta-9 desaturase)